MFSKEEQLELWAYRYKEALLKRSLSDLWKDEKDVVSLISDLEPLEVLNLILEQLIIIDDDSLDNLISFLVAMRESKELPF